MNSTNTVTNEMVNLVLSGQSCAKVAKANNVSYNSLYSRVWTAKKNGATNVVELPVAHKAPEETDAQILERLTQTFTALDTMVQATLGGVNKSLIVSGPAGLGKSFGTMLRAEEYEKNGGKVAVVKGFVRPTGLYKVLYEHRDAGDVVIFDDADSVFQDDIALNLLKGACDMTKKRTLSWRAETRMEDESGETLPTQFEFNGSIIFITNIDFDYNISKGNNRAQHFQAMISRSIYLDLMIKTTRDYLMQIERVAPDMFKMEGINAQQGAMILDFIRKEHNNLRELSLRMVIKLINLMRIDAQGWKSLAQTTCFKTK